MLGTYSRGGFLALTAVLGLFGSPLGGLLLTLDGRFGLRGWQWLFLLEGLPSILLGFLVLRILPDPLLVSSGSIRIIAKRRAGPPMDVRAIRSVEPTHAR